MQEPADILSQKGLAQPPRPPQDGIGQTKSLRDQILSAIRDYVMQAALTGPLSAHELRSHADRVVAGARLEAQHKNYIAVLINNEIWRDRVAAIPYRKRLLLLPQCLRHQQKCRGKLDEYGLICGHCGNCIINDLQHEAERRGYVVIVAEGSPIVTALIESGQVEAVVGVSCLAVLEKVFPYMEAGAVPGLAIPLLQDGCAGTSVDLDWVLEAIELNSSDQINIPDLQELRNEVKAWFDEPALEQILGPDTGETVKIALKWLAKSGKRWRPFLTAGVWRTLHTDHQGPLPKDLRRLAVAVECFHKASLIHDDIEDHDTERYGEKTLHEQYGVPIALNVGDFLLGEGYRLIGELDAPADLKEKILLVASRGHRTLSLGQGAELWWLDHKRPLAVKEVLEIFRQKTAPAFEVALRLGAIYARADKDVEEVLQRYSEALGIAYQIRDDLDDADAGKTQGYPRMNTLEPSILPAIAYDRARGQDRVILETLWHDGEKSEKMTKKLDELWETLDVENLTRELLESYKNQAIYALQRLDNTDLKSMLRRVIGKIFGDVEVMGCCNDYQGGNAPAGFSGPENTQ